MFKFVRYDRKQKYDSPLCSFVGSAHSFQPQLRPSTYAFFHSATNSAAAPVGSFQSGEILRQLSLTPTSFLESATRPEAFAERSLDPLGLQFAYGLPEAYNRQTAINEPTERNEDRASFLAVDSFLKRSYRLDGFFLLTVERETPYGGLQVRKETQVEKYIVIYMHPRGGTWTFIV